jgi:hypothetical protein
MRTWVKIAAIGGFAMLAGQAVAADHGDGPVVKSTLAGSGDIADLYAWKTDGDPGTLALVMTLNGEDKFSDQVEYIFHIGRTADALSSLTAPAAAAEWTTITCTTDGTALDCTAANDGNDLDTLSSTDATAADGVASTSDYFTGHVGNHADPFFFHLEGFGAAVADSIEYATALAAGIDATTGCLEVSDVNGGVHPDGDPDTITDCYVGMLNGTKDTDCADQASTGDTFAAGNVSAIVIEVTNIASTIGGTGGNGWLQVWASTRAKSN